MCRLRGARRKSSMRWYQRDSLFAQAPKRSPMGEHKILGTEAEKQADQKMAMRANSANLSPERTRVYATSKSDA